MMNTDQQFYKTKVDLNVIGDVSLLKNNYDYLDLIRPRIICRKFKIKEILYNANDSFKNIYFINSGIIKTCKTSSN